MRILFLMACTAACILAGCYKLAPDEGELSYVPSTNNPHLIQDSQRTGMFSQSGTR